MFENLFKHWYTFNNNNNRDESETKVELYVSLKKEGKKKKNQLHYTSLLNSIIFRMTQARQR